MRARPSKPALCRGSRPERAWSRLGTRLGLSKRYARPMPKAARVTRRFRWRRVLDLLPAAGEPGAQASNLLLKHAEVCRAERAAKGYLRIRLLTGSDERREA